MKSWIWKEDCYQPPKAVTCQRCPQVASKLDQPLNCTERSRKLVLTETDIMPNDQITRLCKQLLPKFFCLKSFSSDCFRWVLCPHSSCTRFALHTAAQGLFITHCTMCTSQLHKVCTVFKEFQSGASLGKCLSVGSVSLNRIDQEASTSTSSLQEQSKAILPHSTIIPCLNPPF